MIRWEQQLSDAVCCFCQYLERLDYIKVFSYEFIMDER
jgi:hypothetical protein